MNRLKVVDLFAGCGGLSLGFKKSGFDVLCHVEIDHDCCATLAKNASPKEAIINIDITENSNCLKRLKDSEPTILMELLVDRPAKLILLPEETKTKIKWTRIEEFSIRIL